ncbi:MAG: UDP-N-acetylglucosamine 4,6-dehydratase/5-epimerase [Acidimicrobiaceae bacterium]|jgi:UDP-glucose 4-epimerase|nr:UDP-N-acetylglucosamine 4,6-dehydratase/5-epimerase [Acidimicrobiaceae bacterium]MDQ1379059.1 UDP-N-acetylglucosamine 4,6-dehydratase/5-epimerase [Acidimicrobiaceae bacterium]MDQ1442449.1 UDP-N-acetylglucosamine 4,6-dehydratase/5-epimerase [Acidimicrobiaceae bacterium]
MACATASEGKTDIMATGISGSTVLVTGGTGSFGSTLARRMLASDAAQVRIFSRDETKQDQMRRDLPDGRLRFYLGDVRDPASVRNAVVGSDYVFHAAALKQVPSCDFFPLEAVRTNVIGSNNVIEAAFDAGVKTVVCLSTDKAVYPVNAMGMTKGIMEKTVQAFARNHPDAATKVCIVRYGNVMYSRGSVIPLFVRQLCAGEPVTVTDPSMTRFMMTLADSVQLVEFAFEHGTSGDLFIKKAPACTLGTLVEALADLFGVSPSVKVIGVRHGEKQSESLATREELVRSVTIEDYLRIPLDARGLDYGLYYDEGDLNERWVEDYNSSNTEQLAVDEVKSLMMTIPEFVQELAQAGRVVDTVGRADLP